MPTWARMILGLLLVDFVALLVWATWTDGLMAMVDMVTINAWTIALTVDLILSLLCCCILIALDARRRGVKSGVYIAGAMLTGSPAPLLYLIGRRDD